MISISYYSYLAWPGHLGGLSTHLGSLGLQTQSWPTSISVIVSLVVAASPVVVAASPIVAVAAVLVIVAVAAVLVIVAVAAVLVIVVVVR